MTNTDGRVRNFLPPGISLAIGIYRLQFEREDDFLAMDMKSFYPSVIINFLVDDSSGHFHVPLLLNSSG